MPDTQPASDGGASAALVLPAAVRAAGARAAPTPAPGQLWRAHWEDVALFVVVLRTEAAAAEVAPVSLDVELATDDFGTGYSSLSSLIERPVDVLKIDRSFVSTLPSTESVAVVRAIVAMAAALGLDTVAEGVEEDIQLTALAELGCDRVQGFLLAWPMNLAALIQYYADLLRTGEVSR